MGFVAQTILSRGMNYLFDASNKTSISLINFYVSGNDYDDALTQTMTGSSWVSGLIFPIRSKMGSDEAMLMEQGILSTQDKILFLNGNIPLNSSGLVLGIGSPTSEYYTVIPNGVHTYTVNGSVIYKKLWLRQTLTGSLY